MGRIRASFSHFLDVASEEVACRGGVLLSDANIRPKMVADQLGHSVDVS
jgi:hypothetical protein